MKTGYCHIYNRKVPLDSITDRLHIGNRWLGHLGLAMYDNTARVHDPVMPHMLTCDKYASKFPNFSPFSHCGGNPIMFIDPNGESIYVVDNHGYISVENENDDENDIIYNTNKDAFIEVSKDFMANETTFFNKYKNGICKINLFELSADSDEIFLFFRDNTTVEWSQIKTDTPLLGEKDFVGTSHLENCDFSGDFAISFFIKTFLNITEFNHIHSTSSGEPSDSDKLFVRDIHFHNPNATFGIYPKDTRFPIIYYNEKTPFHDNRELPEFTVTL